MRGVFTIATACLVAAAALSQARSAAIPAADDAVAPEMVWFVFTPECFQTLAVEHQLDVPCAKKALAKTVGYGISLGAAIVKIPQILNMVAVGSAGGISFSATFTELIGNTWAAAYNAQMGNPLSSYGESPLIAIQNAVILALVLVLGAGAAKVAASGKKGKAAAAKQVDPRPSGLWLAAYALIFVVGQALPWAVSLIAFVESRGGDYKELAHWEDALAYAWANIGVNKPEGQALALLTGLYIANTVLFIGARVPQIATNFANGHMGTQSVITLFLQAAGTSARIFTAMAETDDIVVTGSFVVSAALNITLFVQFLAYWRSTAEWRKSQAVKAKRD
ncbi:hypothetical protein FNF29_03611 [Cafeteria roenbergensis]|uniref:Mannose-P-dolichol utilization defect 1 protein homolog n=1 Tax=Cafeteria roenbergensis TaxID=33653 RepID=A0A5A8CLY8_CAFRO|nr:hypothetical protein FNF29_03611 [Cafeteria roenbergensis]KAA0153769.1 hypothetical protein FNF28_06905 [Cafeteria roenbergensis]KAA0165796.1 hypothetical protein FNF31_01773 [Cafeteria roenbergensis]|eukprot:KAA0152722.1 hypothetical protein FNF29_03611 [Cafeteria roenbergensis]